ncbi:unnamed protein product [Prorocentrum cordatum]|uniref:Calmodulin n=1 Tax=Prorocentrum cordatum TaxID=2364126 RepID=A0ABN9W1Q1_9DINO|nr:unnamed protein product [Polarella glacialis]
MRYVHAREDDELHRVRQAMDLHVADEFEVVHVDLAKRVLSDLGFPDVVSIVTILRELGVKPELSAPTYSGPRSFWHSVKVEQRLDWVNLTRVLRHLRSEERACRRKVHGFTPEEVKRWTVIFDQCASKKVVPAGDGERRLVPSLLRPDVLLGLLGEDYAPALFRGVDLRDVGERLLAFVPAAADPGMDVHEFLKMMSAAHEDADARYHHKLRCAEAACGFAAQEVREFRAIFARCDGEGAGLLPFEQVVGMVHDLTPLKAAHVAELYALWEEVVLALDAETAAMGPRETLNKRLPQKPSHYFRLAAHLPGSTDFPEFLCLMERLLAINFHDIVTSTSIRAAELENLKNDERRSSHELGISPRRAVKRRPAVFAMRE